VFRICSNVIVTLFLALNWLAVGHAEELKPAAWSSAPEALQKCEELETGRKWGEAIQLYEKALESFAGDQSLKYGLRRARIHHAVERRYGDLSFQGMLNDSGRTQLLNMFEDVYRSVQREYLESVSLTRFLAHGTESLYMALKNPVFIEKNFPDPAARQSRINSVRQTLISTYWNRPVSGVAEARQVLGSVCDLCRRELNLKDSAVLLEYVFGGCNALDEYSVLLTPDRYRELHGTIQGEMVGLGIEMKAEAGRGMHLLNVLLGSPAEEGGLRPDDYITDINSTDCRNLSTDDCCVVQQVQRSGCPGFHRTTRSIRANSQGVVWTFTASLGGPCWTVSGVLDTSEWRDSRKIQCRNWMLHSEASKPRGCRPWCWTFVAILADFWTRRQRWLKDSSVPASSCQLEAEIKIKIRSTASREPTPDRIRWL
jgi:hypothetical protein